MKTQLIASAFTALLLACSGDESTSRTLEIVARNNGCSPTTFEASTGEQLTFAVTNQAGGLQTVNIEGIEGMPIQRMSIPDGRTVRINYTAPAGATVQKLKCDIGTTGASTTIELKVAAAVAR